MQRTHSLSFLDLWIRFLACLCVTIVLGLLFIQFWLPAIAAFIAAHWLLISVVGFVVTVGVTAPKTVPLGWKAFRAIKTAQYEDQDREIYQNFLKAATAKVDEGYNVKYHNARAQESLELINPYASRAANRVRVEEEPEGEQLQIAAPLPTMVRYEDIKSQIPQNHALVGIDGSGVVTRDREVRALTWVVGGSGTGKTNSTVLRVEEDYTWGHWFIPIDPHWFKKDSLYNAIKGYSDRFIRPLAYETADIIASLNFFLDEFDRRKKGGKWDKPITIIIDEVGSLVTDKPENDEEVELIAKIKKVARICGQESRGFDMTGIFISQDAAGLAWLRKRALMVIVHQLLQMSERLLACNENREIAREMDNWPKGRTLIFGIGFSEGQKVYQQPAVKPRVVESTVSPVNSGKTSQLEGISMNPNYNAQSRKSEPLNVSDGQDTDPSVNALKTTSEKLMETPSDAGLDADIDELETEDFFEDSQAQKNMPAGVSAEILETIRRMKKVRSPKPLADREISAMVGLGGRKYPLYQAAVRYLESVNNHELV